MWLIEGGFVETHDDVYGGERKALLVFLHWIEHGGLVWTHIFLLLCMYVYIGALGKAIFYVVPRKISIL